MPASSSLSPHVSNPIKSRTDLVTFLTSLLDALGPHTSPGGALIHVGHTGTHYDETAAQLEGFARPLWGLAALLADTNGEYPGAERWIRGLESGTDPSGQEFWGDMRDKDQRMVECAPIGFAIAIAKEKLWNPLSERAKKNIENWLGGMNDKQMPDTNWLWFRVFANLALSRVNSPRFDSARMKADLDHLDTFYVGSGWSRDGPSTTVRQLDYYSSSFAIQFAQLVYSKLAQATDPERCEKYRNRARDFANEFRMYFDYEGRAIPFGRSMVYRFAQSAFWAALAYAFTPSSSPLVPEGTTVDLSLPYPLTQPIIRGILMRNIRYWAHQPGAFASDGTLTLGYNYPNMNFIENYNSPGSVYWCCKAFLVLALDEKTEFWKGEEEPLPLLPEPVGLVSKILEEPYHISVNTTFLFSSTTSAAADSIAKSTLSHHAYILSSGQQCSYPVRQGAAKYGKFGYSATFGYCVPTGNGTLEEAAPDGTLAICDLESDALTEWDGREEFWRVRRRVEDARFEFYPASGGEPLNLEALRQQKASSNKGGEIDKEGDDEDGRSGKFVLRSTWHPWPDVEVETWLVPPHSATPLWHLRIHRVRTQRKIRIAEGGFSVYGQRGGDGRALDIRTRDDEGWGVYQSFGRVRSASASWSVGREVNVQQHNQGSEQKVETTAKTRELQETISIEARACSKAGVAGVAALEDTLARGENKATRRRKAEVVRVDPNSNLIWPRAVLPMLIGDIYPVDDGPKKGEDAWLVSAIFSLPAPGPNGCEKEEEMLGWMKHWESKPEIPLGIRNYMLF